MTGTTIAQAIPIAISPILTRIYTPEDFGVFALFLIIWLFKNIDFFKSRTLEYLGKISFGIYLTHVFLLRIIPPLIGKTTPSLAENQLVYQLVLASSVLILCVLIISFSRKIFPNKIVEVLGFK